jgi:hypothetical protein
MTNAKTNRIRCPPPPCGFHPAQRRARQPVVAILNQVTRQETPSLPAPMRDLHAGCVIFTRLTSCFPGVPIRDSRGPVIQWFFQMTRTAKHPVLAGVAPLLAALILPASLAAQRTALTYRASGGVVFEVTSNGLARSSLTVPA